ncbi:MAG: DUF692 family protein [Parcubacteria group bacterium]|nr:DUF692 family protein [Parcubacteria group bacterium]
MIQLATPISKLFRDKTKSQEIIYKSSCLECREESLEKEELRQYLFHFDKNIICPWSNHDKEFILLAFKLKKDLKLITFHLAAACSEPILKEGIFYSGGREYSLQEMFFNIRANINWLKKHKGKRNITIAVENNNYYPTEAYRHITDTDFIAQVVIDNNIMFLFDLAHAKITTHNKAIMYETYLKELPLDRMIQLHVSKYSVNDQGLAYDAHELPDESLYQEVKEILVKFHPEYLTVEYYEDADKLITVLDKYKRLCNGRQADHE